jgi:hypothetical protein
MLLNVEASVKYDFNSMIWLSMVLVILKPYHVSNQAGLNFNTSDLYYGGNHFGSQYQWKTGNTGKSNPGRQAYSSLLYRLSYLDHIFTLHFNFYRRTLPHWYAFLTLFLNICILTRKVPITPSVTDSSQRWSYLQRRISQHLLFSWILFSKWSTLLR